MQHSDLRRTPLYNQHLTLGGKMVPFAGWEMPVQYPSGLIAEHQTVRERVGLFDVSHMGEIFCVGPEAEAALNYLTCNNVAALKDGQAQYSAITNERGGVVDDVIVYKYSRERYLLCVNASNCAHDFAWLTKQNRFKAEFQDHSARYGQIAVQGPKAAALIESIPGLSSAAALGYFWFGDFEFSGVPVIMARTGYTGEDGFEIFVPWDQTEKLWLTLLEKGAALGVLPCGLGARDSLRLEASFPLHGHELSEELTAYESGLGWVVKLDKGDFMGRAALAQEKKTGGVKTLIGFFLDEPGIARHGDKIFNAVGNQIGVVTSGTKTPTVNVALGMGIVAKDHAVIDREIFAEVRGKMLQAHVVKRPFYSALKK
ncbi:MAG: glycine cleavage system aminomethyltransferase GcvT [Oligoflexia bacterium]|nr:glycine cleavage system aminomethyltransferase GcvT [Oligoflexia bacterium]